MAVLEPVQIVDLLRQTAWPAPAIVPMTAIVLAESGGNTTAVSTTNDYGPFQINLPSHPDVTQACAFDPVCASRAALRISNGGTDFSPWTTFKNGAYRAYLTTAQAAAAAAGTFISTSTATVTAGLPSFLDPTHWLAQALSGLVGSQNIQHAIVAVVVFVVAIGLIVVAGLGLVLGKDGAKKAVRTAAEAAVA